MTIVHSMCFVIQRAHSLEEVLQNAVDLIAREMNTDVCSIYLLDPRDRKLHLTATHGLDRAALGKVSLEPGEGLTGIVVKEMRSLAVEDGSSHPGYRYFPETREERFRSFLGVPLAIQSRPVGAIVVQSRETRSYSGREIKDLTAIAAQLVGFVENARIIDALDRGDEGDAYLTEVRAWGLQRRQLYREPQKERVLTGTPASPGVAIGSAVFRGFREFSLDPDAPFLGEEAEMLRVTEAFEQTRQDVLRIQTAAEREAGEEHAMIFSSHLLLLNDPVLDEQILAAVQAGQTAPSAIYAALEHFCQKLERVSDPYIQERVEDIRDLRSRLLGHLLQTRGNSPTLSEKIVVAKGIPPSLVVELKAEGARGLITERGGPTSHGFLLARSMGIPAVTGIPDVELALQPGETLILDGDTGKVIAAPGTRRLQKFEHRAAKFESRRACSLEFRHRQARTREGVSVVLRANVGVAADLALAAENGAEGIGLYRTEFPFILREEFPTLEEQVRIYRRAYDYFPEGPVNFRLLDLGGDKFLANGPQNVDRNPFRGFRSIRVLLKHPRVLREQVRAFVRAAGDRPLSILIPMVSSLRELREALGHIREAVQEEPSSRECPPPRIGAMIEVPAAVELASEMAQEVDYFSIGSNDLAQYTLAVDRENPRAATPEDIYHPAVLRLIRRIIEAGHAAGREVSLCGELASNWRLALLLTVMGTDSISVSPDRLPDLKRAFSEAGIEDLRASLDSLLALGTEVEIEEALRKHLPGDD